MNNDELVELMVELVRNVLASMEKDKDYDFENLTADLTHRINMNAIEAQKACIK